MADYLNVIYDKKIRPINTYPGKLIDYLINRYKLEKGLKLLEPGLGRGEFLMEFKKRGMECYGVDISSFAGSNLKDINIQTGVDFDKDKLPYEDNFFDIIYSKSLMEHLSNPENFQEITGFFGEICSGNVCHSGYYKSGIPNVNLWPFLENQ